MYRFPDVFIIFDLEFWAEEGSQERNWKAPGEFRDIIDIGGVVVLGNELSEIDRFSWLVRPRLPLTTYITKLTGITQEMVDTAPRFWDVIPRLEVLSRNIPLYSYGGDESVIKENCAIYKVPYRFNDLRFNDLRPVVKKAMQGMELERKPSGELIQIFGIEGLPPHRGMNDSYNQLLLLQELRKRGRL